MAHGLDRLPQLGEEGFQLQLTSTYAHQALPPLEGNNEVLVHITKLGEGKKEEEQHKRHSFSSQLAGEAESLRSSPAKQQHLKFPLCHLCWGNLNDVAASQGCCRGGDFSKKLFLSRP